MQTTSLVAALLLATLFRGIPRSVNGQSHVSTSRSNTLSLVWEQRINASLRLVQTKPCKFLIPNGNCTDLKNRPRHAMNLYIAGAGKQSRGKLTAVLPDRIKLVPTSYDAVLVIDPYPQANFGHPILVFLINLSSSPHDCGNNRRSSYTNNGECITIAQKSRRCTNRLQDRRRKRRCDINFLPTVFLAKEGNQRTQLLQCMSGRVGFGVCPARMTTERLSDECQNSKRCGVTPLSVRQRYCTETCDYAVMVSGGWNELTAMRKTKENVKSMWRYLRLNGFKRGNIMVFVGQPYSIEIDGNPTTKDSVPAENEFRIRSQIKNLCGSYCVDRLVIYLNKPTKSNGGFLIWDENKDGFAEESERYDTKEIIDDLRNCKAKRVIVIADHSFSGVLLEKFRSAKRHSSRGSLKNVVVVASSNANNYPVRGSFTKSWIRSSRPRDNKPRCLKNVIKEVTTLKTKEFQAKYESGSQGLLDDTIYGGSCRQSLHLARTKAMGCDSTGLLQWLRRNRG